MTERQSPLPKHLDVDKFNPLRTNGCDIAVAEPGRKESVGSHSSIRGNRKFCIGVILYQSNKQGDVNRKNSEGG